MIQYPSHLFDQNTFNNMHRVRRGNTYSFIIVFVLNFLRFCRYLYNLQSFNRGVVYTSIIGNAVINFINDNPVQN